MTPVMTSAAGNHSQPTWTGELLLANWETIPLADYELHIGRFLQLGIFLPLL